MDDITPISIGYAKTVQPSMTYRNTSALSFSVPHEWRLLILAEAHDRQSTMSSICRGLVEPYIDELRKKHNPHGLKVIK